MVTRSGVQNSPSSESHQNQHEDLYLSSSISAKVHHALRPWNLLKLTLSALAPSRQKVSWHNQTDLNVCYLYFGGWECLPCVRLAILLISCHKYARIFDGDPFRCPK